MLKAFKRLRTAFERPFKGLLKAFKIGRDSRAWWWCIFLLSLKNRPHLNQFERQLMQPGFQVEEDALRAQGGSGTLLPPGFQFGSLRTSWSKLVLSPSNTGAQGPGVGAESANAGGVWGGQSPPTPTLGALGPNNGLIIAF